MAKNIRFRGESSEDNKTLNLILPDFVLCLRDFSLKLIIDEKTVSANEYLEISLAENKSKAANFNKPRECIRKFFQKRMCFAFPVPGDSDVLENLETLSFDDLSVKFRIATSNFVSHIYSIPPKDLLASKPVTGPMFVTLVDRYVTAIRHGAVPDVDDAFEAVAKIENAKIEKEAIEIFEHQIERVQLPVSSEVLGNSYTEAQQNALDYLRKNVVNDKKNGCEFKAQMKMDNIWNKIRESNNEKVRELCYQKLQEASEKYLKENFENKEYEIPGGYRKYQRDIARLKEAFESDLRDFKEHEIMWTCHGFVKEMKEIEAKIVQADEEFSIKEKEDEQRQNQERIDKLLKKHQKAQLKALEQQEKVLESHYNKLERDRFEQLQTERQKYEELLEKKMKNEKETAQQERNRIITEQEERKKVMEKANKLALENATKKAKSLILENENERKNKGMAVRLWNELQTTFEKDHEHRVINVLPAESQFISDPLREEVLPKTIGLKQHFMPEPYETEMRVNVQVERLQTDKKGLWRKCFGHSRNFEYDAKRLLLEGSLPDHRLYQKICKEYGRKSEIIRNISNGICQNIKEQSKNIVHVWPAYRFKNGMDCSEDQIVFVVITNGETSIQTEYQIFQRHLNEISSFSENENKTIQDNEKFDNFRSDDLAFYVKSKAKQLMETHKNLTRVTVSVIKSSGHEQNDHRMVKLHCIALYVQIKGLIPINDDPFEQFLDGFPVDVREGVFSLYGLPTDLHQNVRMGCALDSGYGTNLGTVGPFFKYETDLHTYLLTSAHVLLVKAQMQKLILDTKVYYGMLGTDTYQPPESISVEHYSRHHLGKLEFAVYREGEQNKPGMEVALVRIDKQRVPIDGKFPTNEINDDYILSLDDIGSYSDVYKYGSVTGLTKGKVRFIGGSVRTGTLYDDSLEPGVTLHEQIEVESADGVPFGKPGDSGALVFRKDEDKLVAIGIFEGKINHTYMVTPIRGIIEVLSEFISHYRDSPTDAHMDFDEQTSNITLKLCHVRPNNVPLPLSAEIGHHISTEITRQTNEIQAIILHHTEHKFDSVKAELTDIKKHIDTTIDNSKREIIESVCGHISSLLPTANNYK